jgi:uncharacterized membrane protein YciS (DUF1049 family)
MLKLTFIRFSALVIINASSGGGNSDSLPFNYLAEDGRMNVTVL